MLSGEDETKREIKTIRMLKSEFKFPFTEYLLTFRSRHLHLLSTNSKNKPK